MMWAHEIMIYIFHINFTENWSVS